MREHLASLTTISHGRKKLGAMCIPNEVHACMVDEIFRRDTLGYDAPSDDSSSDEEDSSESDLESDDKSRDDTDISSEE
jgi:hypothetical protein